MTKYELGIISTYSGLIPLIAGIIVFKRVGISFRLLLFLLLYGFLTDSFVGYLYNAGEINFSRFLFNIYSPVEAVFFSLFFYKTDCFKIIRQIAFSGIFIWPLIWFFLDIDLKTLHWVDTPYNGTFVSAYEIVIASLSTACILHLTTTGEILFKSPLFWSFLGIFIYCFCTFFINALVQTNVMNEIWFLHNIINIITCLIFIIAFLVAGKAAKSKQQTV